MLPDIAGGIMKARLGVRLIEGGSLRRGWGYEEEESQFKRLRLEWCDGLGFELCRPCRQVNE